MDKEPNSPENDLSQLLEDIEYIKKAVLKRNNILHFMEVAQAVRFVALLSGLLIIFTSFVVYLLIKQYGSYELVPDQARLLIFLYIALAFIFVGVLKIRNFLRKAREVDNRITLGDLFEAIYTTRFVEILIPFLIALVGIPLYLGSAGLVHLVLPFTAILFGLLCFAVSGLLHLKATLLMGGWLLLTGFIFLFWPAGLHEMIQLIISFGLGLLIMGVTGYVCPAKKE